MSRFEAPEQGGELAVEQAAAQAFIEKTAKKEKDTDGFMSRIKEYVSSTTGKKTIIIGMMMAMGSGILGKQMMEDKGGTGTSVSPENAPAMTGGSEKGPHRPGGELELGGEEDLKIRKLSPEEKELRKELDKLVVEYDELTKSGIESAEAKKVSERIHEINNQL